MADTRYLKRQHQSWYFCMAIPNGLRAKFVSQGRQGRPGKPLSKIVETLGTQSLAQAQEARWPLVHEWRDKFKRALSGEPLTTSEIEAEAREVYTTTLQRLEADARRGKYPGSPTRGPDGQTITPEEVSVGVMHDEAGEALENEDWEAAAVEIAAIERRKGVTIAPGTGIYRLLAKAILTAQIEALSGRLRLLDGNPSEPPTSFLGSEGIDPVTLRPLAPVRRPQVRIRGDEGM
jgi:hypothetical protein